MVHLTGNGAPYGSLCIRYAKVENRLPPLCARMDFEGQKCCKVCKKKCDCNHYGLMRAPLRPTFQLYRSCFTLVHALKKNVTKGESLHQRAYGDPKLGPQKSNHDKKLRF